jgi:hypothetical protein
MLPGETIHSGASRTCSECNITVVEKVCYSPAGYYIVAYCHWGPYLRVSHYYRTQEAAREALLNNQVNYKS